MAGPLHSEMQAMLDRRNALGLPGFSDGTVESAREGFVTSQSALPPGRGAPVRGMRDATIAGPRGPIPVRHYLPHGASHGRMIYLHGGGWVFGTLDGFDPVCRELAAAAGVEVISVDYGLAPENRFPGPLDDGWAVLRALADPAVPLVIAGDSAGGNLAAALTLRSRDAGGPAIALQMLFYPVLQSDFSRSSYRQFGGGDYLISASDMAWFWDQHVAVDHRDDPLAAPLCAASLAGLPEAIIILAGCDPLHDEGAAYAGRLRADGVKVELRDHPDMAHGFATLIDLLTRANEEVRAVGSIIRQKLDRAS